MRVVDFFSGIGGFSLGLERVGFRTVAFAEIDPYASAVLRKHWPGVPNLGDITTLSADAIPDADLWCGGFPCQPFSVAGVQRGSQDERHLWPHWFRLIRQVRPRWLFMENVPALLSVERGAVFGGLLRDLASCGYGIEWDCLPASAFGAPHRRDRVWIVAYGHGGLGVESDDQIQAGRHVAGDGGEDVANAECGRLSSGDVELATPSATFAAENGRHRGGYIERAPWGAEPQVGRVAYGVSRSVDGLRCLGNAIVPQIASWVGERILSVEGTK